MGDPAEAADDASGGLAVVVMSLACEAGVVEAVRSILDQEPGAAEVVVVNSGGGDPEAVLREAGIDAVTVVNRPERLYPGAARNLGIAATRAPLVAFLAADCLAAPGWLRGRLAAHRAGADAVGSLLTNAYPDVRAAAASALLLHHRRMPHAPASERLTFGLSFDRRLLERLGPFREDLRTGEDTEYKRRLIAAGARIELAETVITAHRYPRRVRDLLRDQWHRGVRQANARAALGGATAGLPAIMLADAVRAFRWTADERDPATRRRLRHGWPLLGPAALAYAAGVAAAMRGEARRR